MVESSEGCTKHFIYNPHSNNVNSTATTDKTFQKFLRIEYIDFTLLALLLDERMIPKVITFFFKEPKFREVAKVEIVDRIQWLGLLSLAKGFNK